MNEDKKNRITSLCATIGVHVLLFVVFFLALAWSAPDPPIPEYGIEFSMSSAASGGAEATDPQEEVEPMEETLTEETQEQPEEMANESQGNEKAEVTKTEDINSPDIVEQKSTKKPENVTSSETSNPTEKKSESTEKKQQQLNLDALMGKKVVDNTAKSSGQGPAHTLNGWDWEKEPVINDQSTETGKIVFNITIDQDGIIFKVDIESSSIPRLTEIYRNALLKSTFERLEGNNSTARETTGKITFIIQSK